MQITNTDNKIRAKEWAAANPVKKYGLCKHLLWIWLVYICFEIMGHETGVHFAVLYVTK